MITQDELNQFDQKCQDLMPLVQLLTIKDPSNTLRGLERDQKLSIMGFSPSQIEEMTGIEQPTPLPHDPDAEVEIVVSEKDMPERVRELKARIELEWRAEYRRELEYGVATGLIENEPFLRINELD